MQHAAALTSALIPIAAISVAGGAAAGAYFIVGIVLWLPRYIVQTCVERTFSIFHFVLWWAAILFLIFPLLHLAIAPTTASGATRACIDEDVLPLLASPGSNPAELILSALSCHVTSIYDMLFTSTELENHANVQWLGVGESSAWLYGKFSVLAPHSACQVAAHRMATSRSPALERATAHCFTEPHHV